MRRVTAVLLVLGLSGPATALVSAGPAGAVVGGITCAHVAGSTGTAALSRCSDSVATKGHGTMNWTSVTVVTWASGKTTSLKLARHPVGGPGQPTDETEARVCPAGTMEFVITGAVTADTTGVITVGGRVRGEVCVDLTTGTVGNEPGAKFRIG